MPTLSRIGYGSNPRVKKHIHILIRRVGYPPDIQIHGLNCHPYPRVSSSNGRTFDSPEAQLGQASRRSNLGQIATPTDRIAGVFNARIV
jgi:hypothetical protein